MSKKLISSIIKIIYNSFLWYLLYKRITKTLFQNTTEMVEIDFIVVIGEHFKLHPYQYSVMSYLFNLENGYVLNYKMWNGRIDA